MITRVAAPLLLLTVTLSLAWSPGFFSVFPFMLPLAILWVGGLYRLDSIAISFLALSAMALVSALVTGASLGYATLFAALAGLYLVARYRLPAVVTPRQMARGLAMAGCLVGLLALYQTWQSTAFGTPYGLRPEQMRLGLTLVGGEFVRRPVGVFHNSNILGQWLVVLALFLLPLATSLSLRARLVTGGILAAAITFTFSRAIWLVATSIAVFLVLRWVHQSAGRVIGFLFSCAALVAWVLVGRDFPSVPDRFLPDRFTQTDVQSNFEQRGALDELGIVVASENPVFGLGYFQFPVSLLGEDGLRPHNVFIQVAAEQGIPVAGLLMFVVGAITFVAWRTARRVGRRKTWLGGALLLLPVSWGGFLLVYSSAADYAVMPIFVLALGYLLAQADSILEYESSRAAAKHPAARRLAPALRH